MLRAACAYALMEMIAGYDARNPRALNHVVAAGAQLVVHSPDILKALRTALEQVLDEDAAKSEQFKSVLENWRAFRDEQHEASGLPCNHLGHSRRYWDVRCQRAKQTFVEKLYQLSTRRQHHSIRPLGPMKNRTIMQQPSA